METKNRTKVYNVIILDKSGSMSSIAVDGVNETIASIKRGQEKNPEQDNILTLVAFCGCEIKKIYENTPIGEVKPISRNDYRPCCMTPLYDAIGNTITAVHRLMTDEKNAIASVTIITDGYENASKEYSYKAIVSLIEVYKSEGWLFAYIGAEHDVEAVAFKLSIDNHMAFEKDEEGTRSMFCKFISSRDRYLNKVVSVMNDPFLDADQKRDVLCEGSLYFFEEEHE